MAESQEFGERETERNRSRRVETLKDRVGRGSRIREDGECIRSKKWDSKKETVPGTVYEKEGKAIQKGSEQGRHLKQERT